MGLSCFELKKQRARVNFLGTKKVAKKCLRGRFRFLPLKNPYLKRVKRSASLQSPVQDKEITRYVKIVVGSGV